jgi:hypothetical protein
MGGFFSDASNIDLQTYVSFSGHRNDLGTSIALHTSAQRDAYLRRNPAIDPSSLPAVRDWVRARNWTRHRVGSGSRIRFR